MVSDVQPGERRICLVGATGMIGQALIAAARDRADIRIVAVARREIALPPGARMELIVADSANFGELIAQTGASVLVSALGTTWASAGKDEAAFRAVDHGLLLACAEAAKAAGIGQLIAVSSVGANVAARSFYLRVKGEAERGLEKLRFPRLDLIRPGLLRGKRTEGRPLERLAMLANPLADLFLHGERRRYRSIAADDVARAILTLAAAKAQGHFIHEHDAILRAARRSGG
jgi:uncharacterized protein YbjT (DUF2867 family)